MSKSFLTKPQFLATFMIFRASKINSGKFNQQQGVALMLSVLLLAAISAIAFSLATIVFIELRATSDTVRSEPALYATLGVTEEALFQYKRFVPTSQMNVTACTPANQNICTLGAVTLQMPGEQPLRYDDVPRLETVRAGRTSDIQLFELGSWDLEYGRVVLDAVPFGNTGTLNISLKQVKQDGTEEIIQTSALRESDGPLTINLADTQSQYELQLQNSTNQNFLVSITTYGPDNTTEKGLPFIGKQVLKVVANYLGITRTYKVYIPVP